MSTMETFEDYWARVMPRHMENARREWEARAMGPIKGTVQSKTHEGLSLNIPSPVVVHGQTEAAVAGKIIDLLEASRLVGVHDAEDATEWRILCKRAQQRLSHGDYDFSIGAVVCLDICVERQA